MLSFSEIGTEIGIGVVSAPVLLKTAAGKATLATSGVYNIATGAAGIDPTERDKQGKGREMTTVERGLRIAGGVLEAAGGVSGAGEEAATLGKAGRQSEEVVEAVTNEGVIVRTKVPKQTAVEAAGAKPVQTADELNSKIVTVDSNGNPSGTRFRSDYEAHIKTREFSKASQREGVSGCHDLNELQKYDVAVNPMVTKESINIISKTPHPTIKGVYKIEYQMPTLDVRLQSTGVWRNKKGVEPFIKTVYDSTVISDAQMARWGREAFADAMQKNPALSGTSNIKWEGTASNGLRFEGYADTKGSDAVRTFYPIF